MGGGGGGGEKYVTDTIFVIVYSAQNILKITDEIYIRNKKNDHKRKQIQDHKK